MIDWDKLIDFKKFVSSTEVRPMAEIAWKKFIEDNFVLKSQDDIMREKALNALKYVVEDIEMLQDGRWEDITDENCKATLDNLVIIMNYLESQMKK